MCKQRNPGDEEIYCFQDRPLQYGISARLIFFNELRVLKLSSPSHTTHAHFYKSFNIVHTHSHHRHSYGGKKHELDREAEAEQEEALAPDITHNRIHSHTFRTHGLLLRALLFFSLCVNFSRGNTTTKSYLLLPK